MKKTFTSTLVILVLLLAALTINAQQPQQKYEIYKCAATGEYFAYDGDFGDVLYLSKDGINFHRLKMSGYGGTTDNHDLSFEDPLNSAKNGRFHFAKPTIRMEGKTFVVVRLDRSRLKFTDFPKVRVPVTLIKINERQYVYVSADKYDESVGRASWKIFVGPLSNLESVPIRSTDGTMCGSFRVHTAQGMLDYHTPDADVKPSWQKNEGKEVGTNGYSITESGNTVTVKKK